MTQSEIQYRPGEASDAEAVYAILEPFVEKKLLLRRTIEEIRALTKHSVAAVANGTLVGFAAVEIYSRKLAEIQCLAVASDFQDKGIGKEVVARCVAIAAEANVLELMAISSSEKFLQECGFDYCLPGQKRALFIDPQGS